MTFSKSHTPALFDKIVSMKKLQWILRLLWLVPTSSLVLPPAVVHTACGFVAGSAGAIAAYRESNQAWHSRKKRQSKFSNLPFVEYNIAIDFVKSQLQTEAGRAKYSGGVEAALDIVQKDGILALYRGVIVQVITDSLQIQHSFFLYSKSLSILCR